VITHGRISLSDSFRATKTDPGIEMFPMGTHVPASWLAHGLGTPAMVRKTPLAKQLVAYLHTREVWQGLTRLENYPSDETPTLPWRALSPLPQNQP
jgi:hypothetical protein